jgi:hypothetical protein
VCGVWCVVCGVWCAVCGVRCAVRVCACVHACLTVSITRAPLAALAALRAPSSRIYVDVTRAILPASEWFAAGQEAPTASSSSPPHCTTTHAHRTAPHRTAPHRAAPHRTALSLHGNWPTTVRRTSS